MQGKNIKTPTKESTVKHSTLIVSLTANRKKSTLKLLGASVFASAVLLLGSGIPAFADVKATACSKSDCSCTINGKPGNEYVHVGGAHDGVHYCKASATAAPGRSWNKETNTPKLTSPQVVGSAVPPSG